MRIYDLDYCHSVAPDLLVNGAGTILVEAVNSSYGEVKGYINSDGSFDVNHYDVNTWFLKAEGLDSDSTNSVNLDASGNTIVEHFPNGKTRIVKEAFTSLRIGGQPSFIAL